MLAYLSLLSRAHVRFTLEASRTRTEHARARVASSLPLFINSYGEFDVRNLTQIGISAAAMLLISGACLGAPIVPDVVPRSPANGSAGLAWEGTSKFKRTGAKGTFDEFRRLTRVSAPDGHTVDIVYDAYGRVASFVSNRNITREFLYRNELDRVPYRILRNGIPVDRGNSPMSKVIGSDSDYDEIMGYLGERVWESINCPTCIGWSDDLNSAIANLANWLGVGGAIGSVVGLVVAQVFGATAETALSMAGLSGVAGLAVVIAYAGGYAIGTFIYDSAGNLIYGTNN